MSRMMRWPLGPSKQVALQFGDARPVLHVATLFGLLDLAVFRRQHGDGALDIADGAQVLVDAHLVQMTERGRERFGVRLDGVEDTAFARDPAFVALAEDAVEQLVRDHLRRQRAVAARPAQVALNALAE